MIVDSHCHLDYPGLVEDLESVRARAQAADVGTLLTISTRLSKFEGVRAIAERFDDIYCTVGVHPHEAGNETLANADRLIEEAAHPKVIGIGETGLDFYYDRAPREAQAQNFRLHMDACRETGLPLIVHTRDADETTAAMLSEALARGAFPGLLHCFTGGAALAHQAVELGFYVSFSGILTFKRSKELRAIAAALPVDRILVETDAPYLAPEPHRGKPNEPAYVQHTLACLAQVRGLSVEAMANQTTENFFRLFEKAEPPQ